MIEPAFPLAPKITCMASLRRSHRVFEAVRSFLILKFTDPLRLELRRSCTWANPPSTVLIRFLRCSCYRRSALKHHGFGSLIGRSEPSERNGFSDHLLAVSRRLLKKPANHALRA